MKRSSFGAMVLWSEAILACCCFVCLVCAQPEAEATLVAVPVIWDDFPDGKITHRTVKDPWGRPLPEWTIKGGAVDGRRILRVCAVHLRQRLWYVASLKHAHGHVEVEVPLGERSARQHLHARDRASFHRVRDW